MIVIRQKGFSSHYVIEKITNKLEKDKYEDYGVGSRIPDDSISINPDPNNIIIYLPEDYEYSQYDIDDYIRSLVPYLRTNTFLDRNLYTMKVSGRLNEVQLIKLIKYIIDKHDYCVLLDSD